jgi:hypothetical protein
VARLVHHLEKIDALRLADLVIWWAYPLQASRDFSVDVKTFEDELGCISVDGKLRSRQYLYTKNFVLRSFLHHAPC